MFGILIQIDTHFIITIKGGRKRKLFQSLIPLVGIKIPLLHFRPLVVTGNLKNVVIFR